MSNSSEKDNAPRLPLTAEEFDALVALDGGLRQQRQMPEIELRLRHLGLIEPHPFSGLPMRTEAGELWLAAALDPVLDHPHLSAVPRDWAIGTASVLPPARALRMPMTRRPTG